MFFNVRHTRVSFFGRWLVMGSQSQTRPNGSEPSSAEALVHRFGSGTSENAYNIYRGVPLVAAKSVARIPFHPTLAGSLKSTNFTAAARHVRTDILPLRVMKLFGLHVDFWGSHHLSHHFTFDRCNPWTPPCGWERTS